jgi:hypothetical protein
MKLINHFCIIIMAFAGCAPISRNIQSSLNSPASAISIYGGTNWGGIVENRNIDGITGATKLKYSGAAYYQFELENHQIETGLEYVSFDQQISYQDPLNSISGGRNISFSQIRIPFTYHFPFFSDIRGIPLLTFKAGISIGYLINKNVVDVGSLPQYKLNKTDIGFAAGLAFQPLKIGRNGRIGFFLDAYRGNQVYEDIYHKSGQAGNGSALKFGIFLKTFL